MYVTPHQCFHNLVVMETLSVSTGSINLPACAVSQGFYRYMSDLQSLDAKRPVRPPQGFPGTVTTPLNLAAWESYLALHPDCDFRRYIITGIQESFRIGCDCTTVSIKHRDHLNLPSVNQHAETNSKYIATERQAGCLLGPVRWDVQGHYQISPIGLIPKPHQPGK